MASAPKILHDAPELSEHEAEILRLLAGDGRITNSAMADAMGIPPSTSLLRMQALRKRGIIRGFHADVDRHALGLHLAVLVAVDLDQQDPATSERFIAACQSLEHVATVFKVSGQHDFLLLAYVTSTDQLLERVIHPLNTVPHVRRTDTSIVFEHWQRRGCIGSMAPS